MDPSQIKRRIDTYEEAHPPLTRAKRELIAAQAPYRLNAEPPSTARRYPLGVDADPKAQNRTVFNRNAVKYVLTLYFHSPDTFADRTTSRDGSSAVGLPINGRIVTRAEMSQALVAMMVDRSDLYIPLWWVYGKNHEVPDAARELGISKSTCQTRVRDGLNRLVDELWR